MAIISCPQCQKSISDKHQSCPHCNIALEQMNEQDQRRLAARTKLQKQQGLMNQSFIALIFFLGGFLVLYWQHPEPGSWQQNACYGAIVLGFIWYLINRVRLVFLKRKKL
ncbi:hypothetical protein CWC31_16155 [Pseudoalteromonas ruthenica]|uniref:hypothetical protein n=1 Tax=Pseudoalteromonas ruthenica TaxID=151081 RepID=UPI001107F293|nr:hypothetical protein [Pseudoalteromonas ruthenica]TLX49471.1 hypothetical protein CWC31_16155 [Pseudoalteromonas ruthenica]